jgi:hypothetical protein
MAENKNTSNKPLVFGAFLSRQKLDASSKVSKLRTLNTNDLCRRSNCTTFAMRKDEQRRAKYRKYRKYFL